MSHSGLVEQSVVGLQPKRLLDKEFQEIDVTASSLADFQTPSPVALSPTWDCQPLTRELCDDLQAEWASLAEVACEKNIFQFHRFIVNSLPLLSDQAPRIVTIREHAMLVGIVILRRDFGYAKLPVRFWRSALHHEQFLGTPLVRAGSEDAFAAGLCGWLDNAPRDYCFLKLSIISADGALAQAITSHCKSEARRFLIANRHERAAIAPADKSGVNAEDLLSPSRRKSIRKATKRLAKEGDISIERLRHASQLSEWTSQFLAMENTGWKHENGSAILCCENETTLYKMMIDEAFKAGNLHFSRLCVDGTPIAYTLDIVAPPAGYCFKSAIDQSYRKFSPGVMMEYETLKYYLGKDEIVLLDSCSAPDNVLLNEMWPDRKAIMDLAIARKGLGYSLIFRGIQTIKRLLKTGSTGLT